MRAAVATVLSLACAACTVWDARSDLELRVPERTGRGMMTIELLAEPGATIALAIDGKDLGSREKPGRVVLNGANWSDGWHTLSARVVDSPYEAEPQTARFLVDGTPPEVTFDPPSGGTVATGPFPITVRVRDAAETGVEIVVTDHGGTQLEASVTQVDDLTWTVVPARSLEDAPRALLVHVVARDALGNVKRATGEWFSPRFEARVELPWQPSNVYGRVIPLRITFTAGDRPENVTLYADDRPVGSFAVLGTSASYMWNSAVVQDGTYLLRVGAPGWRGSGDGTSVTLDNTPPGALRCVPPRGFENGLPVRAGITVAADEPIRAAPDQTGLVTIWDGDVRLPSSSWYGCVTASATPTTLRYRFEPGAFLDTVGNPTAAPLECLFDVPIWLAPAGDGPLGDDAGPWTATAALGWASLGYCGPPVVSVARVDAAGVLHAPRGVSNATPGAGTTSLRVTPRQDIAWIERVGDGPGLVHTRMMYDTHTYGPLNGDPAKDAAELAVEPGWPATRLAWSEATPEGGRSIRTGTFGLGAASAHAVSADPTAEARSPSISRNLVAYVERVAGGPARLHVKTTASAEVGGWAPVGGVLNRDPLSDAASPAIARSPGGIFVAWEEDGDVLVREWDATAETWSAPVVLDADPARPARTPRIAPEVRDIYETWVLFSEETPEGDALFVRKHAGDASSWELVPEPINAGAVGTIGTFDVFSATPVGVTWIDDEGRVRLRVENR